LVLKTIDGETIDLASLYGKKAVYLKFWATWCTPCREQMPHFQKTYESAGADLAVIAIDVGFNDSIEQIRKYRRQLGITMPIVFDDDGHLATAFNLRVTPQHIVIGRNGRIQYIGHLADRELDAALLTARAALTDPGAATAAARHPPGEAEHFDVGAQMPTRSAKVLGGKPFQFANRGRATILVFLSPWCEAYLVDSRPAMSESCRSAREQVSVLARDPRARWLGVASGLWATPDDLREYRAHYKVDIPLTLDESGALFRAFRVTNVPTVVVADPQGKIVRRVEPGDTQGLNQVLESL
jgi:thiol-disulfide isomerase/thioredoxin